MPEVLLSYAVDRGKLLREQWLLEFQVGQLAATFTDLRDPKAQIQWPLTESERLEAVPDAELLHGWMQEQYWPDRSKNQGRPFSTLNLLAWFDYHQSAVEGLLHVRGTLVQTDEHDWTPAYLCVRLGQAAFIDFARAIEMQRPIFYCKMCMRPFAPTTLKNKDFCDRPTGRTARRWKGKEYPPPGKMLTCADLGPTAAYKERSKKSPVQSAYDRAYRTRWTQAKKQLISQDELLSWRDEAEKRREVVRGAWSASNQLALDDPGRPTAEAAATRMQGDFIRWLQESSLLKNRPRQRNASEP